MRDYNRNMLLVGGSLAIIVGGQRLGVNGWLATIVAFLFVLVVLVVEALAQRRKAKRTRTTLRRLEDK